MVMYARVKPGILLQDMSICKSASSDASGITAVKSSTSGDASVLAPQALDQSRSGVVQGLMMACNP